MPRTPRISTLLALAGIAALPACSMFGGGNNRTSSAGYPSQTYASATPTATTSSQSAELTLDTVRSVQQSLQQDGLYRGQVDGVWGPATRSAVSSYQQQHNLNATGQLDPDTLSSMNQGPQPPNQHYGSNEPPNYNPPPSTNPPPNPSNTR